MNELNFQWSDDSVSDNVSVNRTRELVEYATSTQITDEEAEMIHQSYRGEFRTPYRNRQGAGAVKAGVMANYNGINFISTNHTADYVEIAAWGPGLEFIPSFVRNTDSEPDKRMEWLYHEDLLAKPQTEEPYAGNLLVRVCGGAGR